MVNPIDSSRGQSLLSSITTTTQLTSSTYNNRQPVTTSVPHQSRLNTATNLPQNIIEKSKVNYSYSHIYLNIVGFSKVNIQAEYQQKGTTVEDDDFIPSEPSARTDYGKKALVNKNINIS